MPRIDIDLFDESPKVGDKVKVMGKVKSINEDTGEVEVSYDDVSIVKNKKKRNNNDDDNDYNDDQIVLDTEMNPETQTLDSALGRAFPNTQ